MMTVFRGFDSSVTSLVDTGSGKKSRLEKISGCDGRHHVVWPIRVFYNTAGEVVFAESQPLEKVELCNGSCTQRIPSLEFMAEAH